MLADSRPTVADNLTDIPHAVTRADHDGHDERFDAVDVGHGFSGCYRPSTAGGVCRERPRRASSRPPWPLTALDTRGEAAGLGSGLWLIQMLAARAAIRNAR